MEIAINVGEDTHSEAARERMLDKILMGGAPSSRVERAGGSLQHLKGFAVTGEDATFISDSKGWKRRDNSPESGKNNQTKGGWGKSHGPLMRQGGQ